MLMERRGSVLRSRMARWVCAALVAGATWFSSWAGTTDVAAEQVRQKFKDRIHVVQPKPVLQGGRFELQPRFGMSVNDAINRSVKLGANGNFHIGESFFVGGLFEWYNFGGGLGGPTDVFEETRNQTGTAADAAVINWLGGLELGYAPIVGKLALFDSSIFFYDVAFSVGGVWIDAESISITSPQGKPGATIGLTSRIFLNSWFALNCEIRDTLFMADLEGAPGTLTNVVTAGFGVSIYIPTAFEYSQKKTDLSGDET
jgi:outer membrane beta-barrel protein